MQIVLASKNPHKLVEIRKITEKFGFQLVLQSELGLDMEVEETGTTFEENSLLKARAVMEATGLPAMADDSGICVDALNDEPGVYSARYGFDDSLDDAGRRQLLLRNLGNSENRNAKFVCVITMVTPQGQVIQARGEVHGTILYEEIGTGGFGYDNIFFYPPMNQSFAQIAPEEKNAVSHRGEALKKFYDKLVEAGYADK